MTRQPAGRCRRRIAVLVLAVVAGVAGCGRDGPDPVPDASLTEPDAASPDPGSDPPQEPGSVPPPEPGTEASPEPPAEPLPASGPVVEIVIEERIGLDAS